MKILLIGEMPSKRGDPKKVLDYRVFDPLGCDRANLFEVNRTDGWNAHDARTKARFARAATEDYDRVVFVGKRVAAAFEFRHDYFYWQWHYEWYMPPCVVFPHPSGLNRWWNDPKNRERAAAFVAEELS